jgi:peroxiredoxin Q/BCP
VPKVGERAPEFRLLSGSGSYVSLNDFLGKRNLAAYFYPKDYTAGCVREAVSFRDAYSTIVGLGAEVVGISKDPPSSHERFARDERLPFPLLSDTDGSVRKAYGVKSTIGISGRVTFVVDKQGVIRHVYSSQVHPSKHVEEAVLALKSFS